jgi:hypothetical protein
MLIDAPSGLKAKFYSPGQVGERFWKVLRARLTGKKQPGGGRYMSFVNLNTVQVNKVIRNMKKDPRGIFVLEVDDVTQQEKYQEWLVDQYLKEEIESRDVPTLDDIIEDTINERTPNESINTSERTQNEGGVENKPAPENETPTQEEEQKQEVVSRIRNRTITPNNKKISAQTIKKYFSGLTLGQLANVDSAVDNAPGDFVIRYNRRTNQYYAVDPKELISPSDTPVAQSGEGNKKVLDTLTSINKSVSKILEVLDEQNKLFKKRQDSERKRIETERRQKRENFLEKGIKNIASSAVKMLAPVQKLIDKILNFLWYTLLGKAFVNFIKWFNNPENKERVETLKRFLKDWWPALLGGLVLFTTPFGKFVRAFVGTVAKLTFKLAKSGIPKLLGLIAKNPKTAAVIGAGAAAAGIGMYMQSRGEKQDKELQKSDPEYGKKPSPMKSILDFGSRGGLGFAGGGMIPLAKAFAGGGEATQLQPFEGGYVDDSTGLTVTGAGADTQATVLQPGEVVFSKKAVDYWGADRLLYMNKMGGGTNIPKFVNNVQLAQGGGMIGGMMRGIGKLFGTGSAPAPKMDFKPSWHGPAPTYEHKSNEVQAFLRSLKVAEGTIKSKNSYDTVYGGSEIPIRQMTVKELINTQMTDRLPQRFGGGKAPWPPKESTASGAYQFMPNTLKQLMKMKVLRPSDKMTPENQDRAAWALAKFRGVTLQQLKTQGLSRAIMNKIAPEWASIPNLQGKSNYNQPVKSPELLRETYQKSLSLGQQAKMQLPGPPVANTKISFVELPPIVQQAGQEVASSGGTKVPQFMPPDNVSAKINASIYGIA